MDTKMPISVDDAVLDRIKEKGGQITVMPGERFERNLAAAVGLEGVNTREVLESVRRLTEAGRLVRHRIVGDPQEPVAGVVRDADVKQCIYSIP